jgi:hypothetical protein
MKASQSVIKSGLTIMVIALIIAVAFPDHFQMRHYAYAIHTDDTRNRLHYVSTSRTEATAMEETFRTTHDPETTTFIRMFPAQNVVEARIKADCMRQSLMLN